MVQVTEKVECEYPLGHRFRRDEAIPQIIRKFSANLQTHFSVKQERNSRSLFEFEEKLEKYECK